MFANLFKIVVISFGLMLFAVQGNANSAKEEPAESEAPKVLYHELKPSFITNFISKDGKKLHYLKVDVSIRAKTQLVVDELIKHDALVRHELVMLLSRQTETGLVGAGQEQIRLEGLKLVQAALEAETGSSQIDDLLFTSFVVQK